MAERDASEALVLSLQQYYQEKFRLYREGDANYRNGRFWFQRHHWTYELHVPNRRARRFNSAKQAELREINEGMRDRLRLRPEEEDEAGRRMVERAVIQPVRAEMRRIALKLCKQKIKFCNTLGWGGAGIITRWKLVNWNRRADQDVVIKSSIQLTGNGRNVSHDTIRREKEMMKMLARAPHISQQFRLQNVGPTVARAAIDRDPSYIIMEYAKYGNLDKWMRMAGGLGPRGDRVPFPRTVLWRFFDCLVKGCIAMQYPPRYQPANRADDDDDLPLSEIYGADEPRYLPERTLLPGAEVDDKRIVHFDLDPQNVLIFGHDDPDDGLNPAHDDIFRLQVADLGLARTREEIRQVPGGNLVNWERAKIWHQRMTGKEGWLLPEQFTADWDEIPPQCDPNTDPTFRTVAGNYDSHSNVWQIGLIMKGCMLLENPPPALEASRERRFEAWPFNGQTFWTYGSDVLQDPGCLRLYGERMCELVAQCLAHVPDQRPSLAVLQQAISLQLQSRGRVPDDWMKDFFGLPPPPATLSGVNPGKVDVWHEFEDPGE